MTSEAKLVGSLAGSVIAPFLHGRTTVWRAHGPWCVGPSEEELTLAVCYDRMLAHPDDFLTCILRFCPERARLMMGCRHNLQLLWPALLVADSLPSAKQPVGARATFEAAPLVETLTRMFVDGRRLPDGKALTKWW